MNLVPPRVDELLDEHFDAIDRHYPAIITATIIGALSAAGGVTYAADLSAAEFLGLSALAILIVFLADRRLHGDAWRRRRTENIAAWRAYCERMNGHR